MRRRGRLRVCISSATCHSVGIPGAGVYHDLLLFGACESFCARTGVLCCQQLRGTEGRSIARGAQRGVTNARAGMLDWLAAHPRAHHFRRFIFLSTSTFRSRSATGFLNFTFSASSWRRRLTSTARRYPTAPPGADRLGADLLLLADLGNGRAVGRSQGRDHLLLGKTTPRHGLLASEREPLSEGTNGPKNLGRPEIKLDAGYTHQVRIRRSMAN